MHWRRHKMRNLERLLFFSVLLIVTVKTTYAQESIYPNARDDNADVLDETLGSSLLGDQVDPQTSLRGTGRFLGQTTSSRSTMTCDAHPRICRAKGSKTPNCCKKKCVDVRTDRLNCGMCGKKCKHIEICCEGQRVNPMFDNNHCGRCHNKCRRSKHQKGLASGSCVQGFCNYA